MTLNQKIYKKELNRIKKYIRAKEKEGFIFVEFPSDMPDLNAMPKRVTKAAIERVRSFRTKSLLKGSLFTYENGLTVPGTKEMERRRKEAGRKAYVTRRTEELKRIPANKNKAKKIEYIPKFDVIDRIRSLIMTIERKAHPMIPLEARKGELLRTFEDTVLLSDEELLTKHFFKFEAEIMENIRIVEYESTEDKVEAGFRRLLEIVNITEPSEEQIERVSSEYEYFSNMEEG